MGRADACSQPEATGFPAYWSRYGLVAVARRFGTLAGLPLLAAPQPRGGAEQRDQHAEDGDLGDPVAEPHTLADDAGGLDRQDDDLLDRQDQGRHHQERRDAGVDDALGQLEQPGAHALEPGLGTRCSGSSRHRAIPGSCPAGQARGRPTAATGSPERVVSTS
jgi:hypothetical protein